MKSKKFINPPFVTNELVKFNINSQHCTLLARVMIDLRYVYIEELFKRIENVKGRYNILDSHYSPLWYSQFFLKHYIRSRIAIESDLSKLYISQNKRVLKTSKTNENWCLSQFNNQHHDEMITVLLSNLPIKELNAVMNNLNSIWDSTFEKRYIFKNQVLLFNIKDYTIEIYTLGSIGDYRYKELNEVIINVPKYPDISSTGSLCIDPCVVYSS